MKVFVGMSGGVDSSVSVALLKRAGHEVTGVFIKVWQPDWMECTWREDRLDAMRVAARLGIRFETLDLEKEYKKEVVDYMISEYEAGRTPNPDVMCNRHVKFGAFYDWARARGADFVATGHYARTENGRLMAGVDEGKDQSYFLWTLTPEKLRHVMFPIGAMKKSEVRALARKFGLRVADKKDSQGLCFIGKVDIKEFLSHYIEPKSGKVLDEKGKTIGKHDGTVFLTLGERHGFTITEKSPNDTPYYIVGKDIQTNTITVSHKSPTGALSFAKNEFTINGTNWIGEVPQIGKKYLARVRHLGELLSCKVEKISVDKATIIFDDSVIVAAGQSLVIYNTAQCLGGGVIDK